MATIWALASNSKKELVAKLEAQEREMQNNLNKYRRHVIYLEQHLKDLHKNTIEEMVPEMAKRLRVNEDILRAEMRKVLEEVANRREEERKQLLQKRANKST